MLDLGLSSTSIVTSLKSRAEIAPPYPAPPGYRWDAITERGAAVLENNQPVIELSRIAA